MAHWLSSRKLMPRIASVFRSAAITSIWYLLPLNFNCSVAVPLTLSGIPLTPTSPGFTQGCSIDMPLTIFQVLASRSETAAPVSI